MTNQQKYLRILSVLILFFSGSITLQAQGFVDIVGELFCEKEVNGTFTRLIENGKPVDSLILSWNGEYDFRLDLNKKYQIEFYKKGFIPQRIIITTQVPDNMQNKVWTLTPSYDLLRNVKKTSKYHTLAEIKYYPKIKGGAFFAKNDTARLSKIHKGNSDTKLPNLAKVETQEGYNEIDSLLSDLIDGGVVESYDEYTNNLEENKHLSELEAGIEKLKNKSKQDSILLNQNNVEIQNQLVHSAKYQLELDRLNAKSRADSLNIEERERRIYLAEQEIENAQNRIKLKNYEIENQKIILISSISGLVLVLILLFFMLRSFKIKKKSSKTLELQNKKLEIQGEGLEKANYLLSMQNIEITASISYAKRIQDAILPSNNTLKNYFQDFFILFKPKDIVSGDFYWTEKVDNKVLFATVDCTGHGVPGAFMSIIGNRLLNEIIYTKKILDPKELLEALNSGVRNTLQQDVTNNNDGMDVALVVIEKIDNEKIKVVFSGAKRPLYYYIKELNEIKTIKGDRKPIGGKYYQDLKFTNKEIILSKDDILYLTSDGMVDQNNPDMKKLGSRKLLEILANNAKHSLKEQHKAIEFELDSHQKGEDQRDDITVVGLKL